MEMREGDIRNFTRNLTSGLFFVDQFETLRFLNLHLANLLQKNQNDLLGGSYKLLFSEFISNSPEPAEIQRVLDRAMEKVGEKPTIHFSMDLGGIRYYQMSFFPVMDASGKDMGWGGILVETTEIQERIIWKESVLSGVVREIRSALATLKGLASALDENFNYWADEMISDFLMEINEKIDSLTLVVDQVLTFSQLEEENLGLNPTEVAVRDLIDTTLEKIASQLKSIRLKVELRKDLPIIRVDLDRIVDVIVYLIQYGLETPETISSLTISAEADIKYVHLNLLFEADENLATRFENFFQENIEEEIEEITSQFAARHVIRIVEAHGGSIMVDDRLGAEDGVAISLALPVLPDILPSESEEGKVVPFLERFGHILIVEKEPDYQAIFNTLLEEAGYRLDLSSSGKTAVNILDSTQIDLILISEQLEDMHGLNLLQTLRRYSKVPVIFIGDEADNELLIEAFEFGADDFMVKPINSSELLARIQAQIRQKVEELETKASTHRLTVRGLTIDMETRQVWKSGNEIDLTLKEFDLLALLAQNQGRVLTYQNIIQTLWEPGKGTRHALSVHVSRLRQKIEVNPQNPIMIHTKWGAGYLLKPSD